MVVGDRLEAGIVEQAAQRRERELVQMARQIEVEPRRAAPHRLGAREVGHRHHEAAAQPQDPVHLGERLARMIEMLEHVPDQHLVEVGARIAGVREIARDREARARIGAARRRLRHLDAVHLEAAIGECAEHDAASAADVEHARARGEAEREEVHVALADPAHGALERAGGTWRRARRSSRRDRDAAIGSEPEHRVEAAEAALAEHHDGGSTPSTAKRARTSVAPHTRHGGASAAAACRARTGDP